MDRIAFFSTPQSIPTQERSSIEWEFDQLLLSPTQAKKVWQSLFGFFYPYNKQRVTQYYDSYWKWFVLLTWKNLVWIPKDQFVPVLLSQLPVACLLSDSIEETLLYYLYRVPETPKEQQYIFDQIKEQLMVSSVVLTVFGNTPITLGSLANSLRELHINDDTLLEKSQLYTKVKGVYETATHIQRLGMPTHEHDSTNDLLRLIAFFSQSRDIVQIVYDYFDEVYQYIDAAGEEELGSDNSESVPAQEVSANFFDILSPHQADFASWISTDAARRELLANVPSEQDPVVARMLLAGALQQLFPNIHEDMNTAGAIVELDNYLQSQGLTAEHDFLYFDDTDAGFHWHSSYLQ